MRSRLAGLSLVVLVVVASAFACSDSKEKESTRPTVPSDYVDFEDAEDGVSLAVPKDWEIPRNPEVLQQRADAVRSQNPRLADIMLAAKTLVSKAKVFAVHPQGSSSMNLLVEKAGDTSLDDIPGPATAELRRRGVTIQSQERTTLGGVEAIKVAARLPLTDTSVIEQVQYYAVTRGKVFILTLTGSDPALRVIVDSVRLS